MRMMTHQNLLDAFQSLISHIIGHETGLGKASSSRRTSDEPLRILAKILTTSFFGVQASGSWMARFNLAER
jgi:hypothetical protein